MNEIEKRMVQAYWKKTGGIRLDSFRIALLESGEGITADALIVMPGDQNANVEGADITDREVVALYAIEGTPTVSLIGKALIGNTVLKSDHAAKTVRTEILCTKKDPAMDSFLANMEILNIMLFNPNEIMNDRFDLHFSLGKESSRFICNIEPLRDYVTSQIREYHPDQQYRGIGQLHKYGKGPFCVFTIPITTIGMNGIYAIVADEEVKYIGACDDLYDKFHFQFGHIQPRDCYSGGHPEKCRINHLLMNESKDGNRLKLFFQETGNKESALSEMIRTIKPKWNIHGKRAPRQKFPIDVSGLTGFISRDWGLKGLTPGRRYKGLTDYLKKINDDEAVLEYGKIEQIIQKKLPPSAYKYAAWWSNSNKTQGISWLAAGWRVKGIDLGNSIVFRRVDK